MAKRQSSNANTATFEWRALPPMRFARSEPLALVLEDDRLLVVGKVGWNWDAQLGWQKREDLPPEVLASDRSKWQSAADLVAPDGALRGVRGVLWDRKAADWITMERMPERPAAGSLTLPDGSQVVVGGKEYGKGDSSPTALASCLVHPAKGEPRNLQLTHARIAPTLTTLPDGRVLVSGGIQVDSYVPDHDKMVPVREVEIIDPGAGTVKNGGALVKPRYGHAVAVLRDGSVFVAGGADDLEAALAETELGVPSS